MKIKTIKQKKALAGIGIAVAGLAIVGVIAYNMDALDFDNLFRIKGSVEEYTDVFESPTNWSPCQEVDKTAIATNKNEEERYARMKINEYWRTTNTQTPSTDHETTDLSLTWNDNGTTKKYAVINTQNDNDWELKSDGWYYYKYPLGENESTNSLLKSVTFNCDAKLVEDGTPTDTATGQSAESVPTAYAGAKFHVYVTMQLSSEEWEEPEDPLDLTGIVKRQANPEYEIDFRRGATISDDVSIANGNGVNKYTEDGQDVYYYRGVISNNNVIFADMCWKILRTTSAGGTKLIYNGRPVNVIVDNEIVKQCNATGTDTMLQAAAFMPSSGSSPTRLSNVGYMYGDQRDFTSNSGSTRYYSKNLIRNGSSYSLSLNDYLYTDYYVNKLDVAEGYHYYCINKTREGSDECDADGPGYIISYDSNSSFYALPLNGYDDIETAKAGIFANNSPSYAKTIVEQFFNATLTTYENQMDDVVFCNDRSFYYGSLKAEASDASNVTNDVYAMFSGYGRNSVDINNNYHPSLDCANANDSFTKDSANGNGKLNFKVGLITADEVTMAGITTTVSYGETDFLYNGQANWTMTPSYIYYGAQPMMYGYTKEFYGLGGLSPVSGSAGFRPVISLKAGTRIIQGGEGTQANPYVIE